MNIPLNINWQQMLLHLLNFVILAGGLYLLLYKPVKSFMEKREAHYKEIDHTAEEKLLEAERTKEQYEKSLTDARAEISEQKAKALKDAEAAAAAQLEQAKEQSKKIISAAKEVSLKEREKILAEARAEVAQMAVEAVGKLLAPASDGSLDDFLNSVREE